MNEILSSSLIKNNEQEEVNFLSYLKEWVDNLYSNLTDKLNSLKKMKIFFNKPEITECLSSLVIDLEKYFYNEINSIIEENSQFDNFSKKKENFALIKDLVNNSYRINTQSLDVTNFRLLNHKLNLLLNKNNFPQNQQKNNKAIIKSSQYEDMSNSENYLTMTTIFSIFSQNYEKHIELKDYGIAQKIYEQYKNKSLNFINYNVKKIKIMYKIFNYLQPIDNLVN